MYDLDPMLDGEYSRRHRQQIARQQAKRERIAREVESIQKKRKSAPRLFTILTTVARTLWQQG